MSLILASSRARIRKESEAKLSTGDASSYQVYQQPLILSRYKVASLQATLVWNNDRPITRIFIRAKKVK